MSGTSTTDHSKTSQEQQHVASNDLNEKQEKTNDVEYNGSQSTGDKDAPEPVVTLKTWVVCVVCIGIPFLEGIHR